MKEKQKNLPIIQSLQTGLQLLDLVSEHNQSLKFTEIKELSGITKSNLYKYLNTLTQLNLLQRDKKQNTYSLGSKLIEYGICAIGSQDVIGQVAPYLQEISRKTYLTTLLSVWTYEGPVIANIRNVNYGLNIGAQIGTRLPLMSSAGKIFSVFRTGKDTKEWRLKELHKSSDLTRKSFEEEQERIRLNYFSYANEPLVDNVSSFSVPLLDYKTDLLGTLTVVGFTTIIPENPESEIGKYVLECANEISKSFGYRKNI